MLEELKSTCTGWSLVLVLLAGCGGGEGLVVRHPWEPDLGAYFDDSVDFTMNPESLSGQWLYDYRTELSNRVQHSDYILAVRVDTVSVKTDVEGKQHKNLIVDVEKEVKGDFPDRSAVLSVADDQPGFDSFEEDDPRLMDKVYVAFLRVYEKESGEVGLHWHLSPLSEGLMEGMEDILEQSEPQDEKDEGTKVYTIEQD
jgi:hypothetical protein